MNDSVNDHSEMSPYFIALTGNKLNCWGKYWHKHETTIHESHI